MARYLQRLNPFQKEWLETLLGNTDLSYHYLNDREKKLVTKILAEDEYDYSEKIRLNSIVSYYTKARKDKFYDKFPIIITFGNSKNTQ